MTLTKHARQRYHERFGAQDDKVIIERALKATQVRTDGEISHRQYGAICFVILDDLILTIKKYKI